MKNNTSITKTKKNQEMRKYIVEAPAPQKGQSVSSGGIRENGKLKAQYRNPVPYTPPVAQTSTLAPSHNTRFQEGAKDTGLWFLQAVVNNYVKPVAEAKLKQLAKQTISQIIQIDIPPYKPLNEDSIEAEYVEVYPEEDNEKIVHFPNKHVR